MDRNIRSPLLSMNVTSWRFTMHRRLWVVRCALFQFAFSSLTYGATRRPCRVHSSSFVVLVMVIFSIRSFSAVLGSCKCRARRMDLRHGARRLGLHKRRFFSIGAASSLALSPPASSHRDRIHGSRPVRCESRKLFVGSPLGSGAAQVNELSLRPESRLPLQRFVLLLHSSNSFSCLPYFYSWSVALSSPFSFLTRDATKQLSVVLVIFSTPSCPPFFDNANAGPEGSICAKYKKSLSG